MWFAVPASGWNDSKIDLNNSHGVATKCQTVSVETCLVPAFTELPVLGAEGEWGAKRQVIVMHPESSNGSRRSTLKLGLWDSIHQEGSSTGRPGERRDCS